MADRPGRVRAYRQKGKWRGETRRKVLARSGNCCAACGWPGTDGRGRGLHLAHIFDHDHGGPDDASNLVALCPHDHALYDAQKRRDRRQ